MSRGDGFANADLDVGFFRDQKVKRLAREHADVFSVAVNGYFGIVLHCWACGERVSALDAWPDIVPWSDAAVEALRHVELLDRTSKLPVGAWNNWFGPAFARREVKRGLGAIGGKKKAQNRLAKLENPASAATGSGLAQLDNRASVALAVVAQNPTRPSVRPSDKLTPKPPQVGARPKARRGSGENPRATGDAPRQREEAVKRGMLAALNEMGGVKSMPPGLRDEEPRRSPLTDLDRRIAEETAELERKHEAGENWFEAPRG